MMAQTEEREREGESQVIRSSNTEHDKYWYRFAVRWVNLSVALINDVCSTVRFSCEAMCRAVPPNLLRHLLWLTMAFRGHSCPLLAHMSFDRGFLFLYGRAYSAVSVPCEITSTSPCSNISTIVVTKSAEEIHAARQNLHELPNTLKVGRGHVRAAWMQPLLIPSPAGGDSNDSSQLWRYVTTRVSD